MPLTDSKIRATKPSPTPFKLTASHSLYLLINPGGSRLWYLKYHFDRKEYSARWIREPCRRI
ncbi:Arm DNA-binding domain-containing protein [Salmonella enterica]